MPTLTPFHTARAAIGLASALALSLAGCASDAGSTEPEGGGETVDVTLQEFSIMPSADSAPAGQVTFSVTNDGPDDIHEFVVIATDLDPGELPTDENGAVQEEGEGMTVIDEIEDIPVGETQELTVDLDAGNYVLVCNIYDEDEQEAHYRMGMYTAFEATD
jgi:uncharacterized cupredoxin-like copper-binding protein